MHIAMILGVWGLAWCLRWMYTPSVMPEARPQPTQQERWQKALFLFLLPPLLVLMTAIAVVFMGPQGQMLGFQAGWFSYIVAIAFLLYAVIWGCILIAQGSRAVRKVSSYPKSELASQLTGQTVRAIVTPQIFAAQVGFWQPHLVVSEGMLQKLEKEHLNAVLKHEQAHDCYRDTFWFFCLGYIKQVTAWLPNTNALWQELLLLREMRADRWATQYVDRLLLAEALLWSVSDAIAPESDIFCAAFSCPTPRSRLEERIEAILDETTPETKPNYDLLGWLILSLLPLISIPFHS
jgi:beta-lactamase regulating signal transducer with metallopeptidase domain